MVKSGTDRSDKYAAKYDAEVVRARYTATAANAIAKQVTRQEELALLANFVRTALNNAGIMPLQTITYLSFANKMQGTKNKFGQGIEGTTPFKVAMIAYDTWTEIVGVDKDVLADIFTHVIGSAPSPLA